MKIEACTLALAVLLVLGSGITLARSVRCTTYEEKAMQRLQTLCSDGTRATSSWSSSLQAWQTTVTPPPSPNSGT